MRSENFCNWLSGFVDGEGCFYVAITKRPEYRFGYHAQPKFQIGLSIKDKEILFKIKKFFGCGTIAFYKNKGNSHDEAKYQITGKKDLIKVISHFEKYPLFTKKRNDFLLWKKVVKICLSVNRNWTKKKLKQIFKIKQDMNFRGKTEQFQKYKNDFYLRF